MKAVTNLKRAPKIVFLGLSGGVDSAVAGYLLKQQGYDVRAVFMQNWDPITNHEIFQPTTHCQVSLDFKDAQAIAQFLKIPLIKVNFVEQYWKNVFQPFLTKIKQGLIPNPDIACNTKIKFNVLLHYLNRHYKFDFFATGHYAQVGVLNQRHYLIRGVDPVKDQTYFLAGINPQLLSKLIFPLGKMPKKAVRQLANQIGLPNATKKDSMGICFIGKRRFEIFLQQYLPKQPGQIIDLITNQVVGEHDGALFYTIGQRKRLNLQTTMKHFVIGKNIQKNIVYVVDEQHQARLLNDSCSLVDINWFHALRPTVWTTCLVKLRHCQTPLPASYKFWQTRIILKLSKAILAITPGQVAVLYSTSNQVLGCGMIDAILKNAQPLWYIR